MTSTLSFALRQQPDELWSGHVAANGEIIRDKTQQEFSVVEMEQAGSAFDREDKGDG